jgi:hypothetical protein
MDDDEELIDEELDEEKRAALNARDRALMERFLAKDKAAERELVERMNSMGRLVARHLWWRLYFDWDDFRGEYFATLQRYREEGRLRVDEPLYFLAQRLMKHAGRKAGIEAHRDQMALSLQGKRAPHAEEGGAGPADGDASWAQWLEHEATESIAAQPRFTSAETLLATREVDEQLAKAAARLAPTERATYEAERAVAHGEHESLKAALGVTEGNARLRRLRMKKALRAIALELGADDLVERLDARKQRK